jgi:hypothetical protein
MVDDVQARSCPGAWRGVSGSNHTASDSPARGHRPTAQATTPGPGKCTQDGMLNKGGYMIKILMIITCAVLLWCGCATKNPVSGSVTVKTPDTLYLTFYGDSTSPILNGRYENIKSVYFRKIVTRDKIYLRNRSQHPPDSYDTISVYEFMVFIDSVSVDSNTHIFFDPYWIAKIISKPKDTTFTSNGYYDSACYYNAYCKPIAIYTGPFIGW